MALMLVAGKIYHCSDCSKEIRVNYEGGAQWILIGDAFVDQQVGFLKVFSQPLANPEKQGYYIHEKVICEVCTQAYESRQLKIARIKEVFKILDTIETVKKSVADEIFELFHTVSDEDIQAVIGLDAFNELTLPHMTASKKVRYINQLFQKWFCTEKFIHSVILKNKDKIKSSIATAGLNEWIKEFKNQDVVLHTARKTWEPENIRADRTMAYPAADTLHITVYTRHLLDMAQISNHTNLSTKNFINDYMQSDVCTKLLKQATLARFVPDATAV